MIDKKTASLVAVAAVVAALVAWAVRDSLRVPMTVRVLPSAPPGAPAAAAAPRTVSLPDGRTRDLAAPPGKLLILHYWATWCPPCVKEFPEIAAFWREFGKKPGVEFLAVSVDEDWKTVDDWMKKNGFAGIPLALDPGRTSAKAFGTEKFPETYVLSPSGQVVDKYIGAVNWSAPSLRKSLENLLSNHPPARAGG